MKEAYVMLMSIKRSLRKILIFMMFVFITAVILGSIMYTIEGDINPQLSSIPKGIYWAIVTLTTVGYGDISPITDMGQIVASIVMILAYSIIAVPTGIISAEIIAADLKRNKLTDKDTEPDLKEPESEPDNIINCSNCNLTITDKDAKYCKRCGAPLDK